MRRVLPALALLAVVVVAGIGLVVRSIVHALPHAETTTATSTVRLVTDGARVAGVETLTAPAGQSLPDSALEARVPTRDVGAAQGEQTSGRETPASAVTASRVDARTVRWSWTVSRSAGDTVVLLPTAPSLRVTRVEVETQGARVASCLVAAGTTNGHPRLRPCTAGAGTPLSLDDDDNSLDLVRLRLAPQG
jgi:hypothetical protein